MVRIVQQYQISGSVDQANQLLSSSLDLMQHELELKYNMLRYLVWPIPTLGFIGTVIGIALGLAEAANMPDLEVGGDIRAWFAGMTVELGIAFNTTLMALGLSAILVFLMHICTRLCGEPVLVQNFLKVEFLLAAFGHEQPAQDINQPQTRSDHLAHVGVGAGLDLPLGIALHLLGQAHIGHR